MPLQNAQTSFVPLSTGFMEKSYYLPEGFFTASLVKGSWSPAKNGTMQAVLSFRIESFTKPGVEFMARAVYWESELPRLQRDLANWQGAEFVERSIKEGGVNLDKLTGKLADIEVVHDEKHPEYDEPRRIVAGIYPVHKLVRKPLEIN